MASESARTVLNNRSCHFEIEGAFDPVMEGYRPLSASEGLVDITYPVEVKIAAMRPRTTKRSVTIAVLLFLSKDKKYID